MTSPLSRRRFLQGLGWGAGAATLAPTSLASLLAQAGPAGAQSAGVAAGRIVVLVQLGGGNDSLDTVVPISGPNASAYQAARGTLARTPDRLLALDDDVALAAELPTLKQWWDQGQLAIVHGVHHANADLSHFSNLSVVWSGSTSPSTTTGWAGRTIDLLATSRAPAAEELLGVSMVSSSPILVGDRVIGASVTTEPGALFGAPSDRNADPAVMAAYRQLMAPAAGDPTLDADARESQMVALEVGEQVGPLLPTPAGDPESLAAQLDAVAALVLGGLPTRIYHVHHDGDFDVHANEAARQPLLLSTLDGALASFFSRLGPAARDVVVATYSEFARRVAFNGSGTDHGRAGDWFVVGPSVVGGHHGEPASVAALDADGNMTPTTDFRSVGATLVSRWLDVDPVAVFGSGVPELAFL